MLRGVNVVLTRVLGVAGGGVGMAGELSSTVRRRARSVWALRTITSGSPMKADAAKLGLKTLLFGPRYCSLLCAVVRCCALLRCGIEPL